MRVYAKGTFAVVVFFVADATAAARASPVVPLVLVLALFRVLVLPCEGGSADGTEGVDTIAGGKIVGGDVEFTFGASFRQQEHLHLTFEIQSADNRHHHYCCLSYCCDCHYRNTCCCSSPALFQASASSRQRAAAAALAYSRRPAGTA